MGEIERTEYSTTQFWEQLVLRSPVDALAHIARLLGAESLRHDALALAHGAAGRCLFEIGRLDEARSAADRALAAATGTSREVRTWVAMGASVVLAEAGRIELALESLEDLAAECDGVDLGRIRVQIAYVLQHTGRLNEALDEFDVSERLFADGGEPGDRLRVHHNRGLVLLQQGRLAAADSDFVAAERIAEGMDMVSARAQSVANRAVLLGRARQLAQSVDEFARAATLFESVGNPSRPVAIMSIDQAEVMMHSGLLADAVTAGRIAVETVEPTGNVMLLGDAHLMAARAELAAGLLRTAAASAHQAEDAFVVSGRTQMVAHARSVVAQAGLIGARTGESAQACIDEARHVATALRSSGWADQADDLALALVRSARRWRVLDSARRDLDRLRSGIADGRRDTALAGWWTEALTRQLDGDVTSAVEACHSGLSVLDEILAEASSLEERSAAMRMGNDLSQFLIEMAIDRGDADTVLAAAEGTRGRALHDELAERRRYQALTRAGADDLRRELLVRLADRTLVEWVVTHDRVWAVVFDAAGSRLVDVGDRREVVRARDRVLVWLDRAAEEPDESSERALRAAQLLDDALIGPLGLPGDSGIVLVPVDALHGIPWSGLPSLTDRPVALAPNAQVWLDADRRAAAAAERAGLVIGPDVAGVELERASVERSHPSVALAVGVGATASAVASMFASCDLVHVAAHGTFRSDHPLLSTLRLHDGEATMYDAVPERVHSKLVILSSCEGGAQGTADGSEVLGLSSVLLARGAAAVLAPLTQVRELECAEFVAEVHGELAAGEPFACAVAAVRQRWLADNDLSRWAVASSFTCFGSGEVTVASS